MNLRLQTTLCPSCSRNVPREAEVCVFCGCSTSISVSCEIEANERTKFQLAQWLMWRNSGPITPSEMSSGRLSLRITSEGNFRNARRQMSISVPAEIDTTDWRMTLASQ